MGRVGLDESGARRVLRGRDRVRVLGGERVQDREPRRDRGKNDSGMG
jgi:hypothetical protein